MKRRIYTADDPHIANIFHNHCKEGWSPRSFVAKLQGADHAYSHLKKINKRFREIADQYGWKGNPQFKQSYPELYEGVMNDQGLEARMDTVEKRSHGKAKGKRN